jgi:arylformamidase
MRVSGSFVSRCLVLLIFAYSSAGAPVAAQQEASTGERPRYTPEQRQRFRQFMEKRRSSRPNTDNSQGKRNQAIAAVDSSKVKTQLDVQYGKDERQRLDIYSPKVATGTMPILLFVHGGGWQRGSKNMHTEKGINYAEHGVVFIATNYRLAPSVTHPKQIQDIASAFAWAKTHATELGADPNRIYIMGHSAGAHLVDLLGSNERFLVEKGLSLNDIRGVISLDTASLNLGERKGEQSFEGNMVGDMISNAFGSDPKVLADASPTLCIHPGKTYPPFLMFCGERRKTCVTQHANFSAAMKKAGGQVTVKAVPLSHSEISKEAGQPDTEIFKDVMALMDNSSSTAK